MPGRTPLALLLLLIAAIAFPLCAQDAPATPVSGTATSAEATKAAPTPPVTIDRAEALKRLAAVTPQKYPDADEVLAAQSIHVTYRPDGTYTQFDEDYVKILTEKSRRDNSTLSSFYTIPYQLPEDCQILLVEILKQDGRVVPVDLAKNSSTVVNSGDMKSNIYSPNDKIIKVNIPGLEIGDTLHYVMYDNIRQPRAAGLFCDLFGLEETRPVLGKEITVTGPESFPLQKIAIRDEIKDSVLATQEKKDGQIIYRWKVGEIAQAFPEPNAPPLYSCLQRLLVSTAPNWRAVSSWYAKLCQKPLAATTPDMKTKVDELTAGAKTPLEKVQKIFYWVSQDIRYLGITTETEAPGYEPHPVKDTFKNRHGVCRDKAALLVAMIRLAGIDAYPVLINNGEKKDAEVAQPYFNHAITAAKIDGKYVLMDSTDESTKDLLPSYLNNRSFLVATAEGDDLRTSPVVPAEENLLRIETTGSLDEKGNLKATSTFFFDGINDNAYRGYFARVSPEERRQYFESRVKDIYGEGKVVSCLIEPKNIQDASRPLKVTLSFTADNILSSGTGMAMLPLPFLGARVGMANFILGETGLEERRFPFFTELACGVEESVRITLPENLEKIASMPVYKTIENDDFAWKRSLAKVDKSLMGKSTFLLKAVEFTPAQYKNLKEALRQIEYNQRKQPLIALSSPVAPAATDRKYGNADSVVLEDEATIVILEAGKWVETRKVKKKVLTYAGQKESSEIKIEFNPVWEKVEVTTGTVTASDGKVSTISPQEINVMDQPWNGMAQRYPGGKTLVASLPGVDVGSTLEYTIRREVYGRPFFSFWDVFRTFDPVIRKSVIVTEPKNMTPIRSKVHDVDVTAAGQLAPADSGNDIFESGRAEVGETAVWRWSVDTEDAVKREKLLPPYTSFVPSLFLSGCASWEEFAAPIRRKLLECAANQPTSSAKVAGILKNANGDRQKIQAIRDFVARTIRFAGPAFSDLPLSTLTPADRTLADRYGNSADRAILLHALLTAAGYQPEFFLCTRYQAARNLPLPQLDLPSAAPFWGVLVRVALPGGAELWLNDSDQYAELGASPAAGQLALDLTTGKFRPVTTDLEHQEKDETFYHIALSADGAAKIRKTRKVYGAEFGALNKLFSEMTPEQKRRFQQEEIANLSQAARLTGDYTADFTRYPGRIEFTVEIPRFAVRDGRNLYFELPQTLRQVFGLRADTRSNPLYLGTQDQSRITTLIALPDGPEAPLIAPKDFRWRSPAGGGQLEVSSLFLTPSLLRTRAGLLPMGETRAEALRELEAGHSILLFTHSVEREPVLYAPVFYAQLLQAQSTLSGNAARTVLLQLPAPTDSSK